MTALSQIMSELTRLMPALRARYGVRELGIFGSVARGESGPESDLDVLIGFEPGVRYSLHDLAQIACQIEDATGLDVDLVSDHPGLRPSFRRMVEEELVRVA